MATGAGMMIRRLRGARSQRAYAELIGVSHTAVQAYERGDYTPTWPVIRTICAEADLCADERHALLDLLLQHGR